MSNRVLPDIRTGSTRQLVGNSSNMRDILQPPIASKAQSQIINKTKIPSASNRSKSRPVRAVNTQIQDQPRVNSPVLSIQSEQQPRNFLKKNYHYQNRRADENNLNSGESEIYVGLDKVQNRQQQPLFPPILQHSATQKAVQPGKIRTLQIDHRLQSQQRLVQYLSNHLSTLQQQMSKILNRQGQQLDVERNSKLKLEQSVKINEQRVQNFNSDLLSRISLIEQQLKRGEGDKSDLISKLRQNEINQREILQYVKTVQQQQNTELNQMRVLLQDRLSEQQIVELKQKEKSAALFTEVVRLGEEHQSNQQSIRKLQSLLQQKISGFEERFSSSEKQLSILQKYQSTSQNTTQFDHQRIIQRIQQNERVLSQLNSQAERRNQTLTKVEVLSLRNNQDFKMMINNLQSQFGSRLSTQITDLVNRILNQQETRNRALQDIRHQFEIKDKFNEDRVKQESEKSKERYNTMDIKVANEFQNKDQEIKALSQRLDASNKIIQGWVKQEQIKREQMENAVRSDLNRFAEQIRNQIDTLRAQQKQQTDDVSSALKNQADLRVANERQSKQLIQSLVGSLTNDIKIFKDQVESVQEKQQTELRELAQQTSDNSHFLSRYIDEEVQKTAEQAKSQFEKLKDINIRVTQSFKQHMITNQRVKSEQNARMSKIQAQFPITKEQIERIIERSEQHTHEKIASTKEVLKNVFQADIRSVQQKLSSVASSSDQNLIILRRAVQTNRETTINIMNNQRDENNSRYSALQNDLEMIGGQLSKAFAMIQRDKDEARNNGEELANGINELSVKVFAAITMEGGKYQGKAQRISHEGLQSMTKVKTGLQRIGQQAMNASNQVQLQKKIMKEEIQSLSAKFAQNMSEFMEFYEKNNKFKQVVEESLQKSEINSNKISTKLGEIQQQNEKSKEFERQTLQKQGFNEERLEKIEEHQALKLKELQDKIEILSGSFEQNIERKIFALKQDLKRNQNEMWEKAVKQQQKLNSSKSPAMPDFMKDKDDMKNYMDDLEEEREQPKPFVKKPSN